MTKAPKCKLCGQQHWLSEPHKFGLAVTPPVTTYSAVTPNVTAVTRVVTAPTEAQMIEAAVSAAHECPICGLSHHRPASGAERQRAYRERHA